MDGIVLKECALNLRIVNNYSSNSRQIAVDICGDELCRVFIFKTRPFNFLLCFDERKFSFPVAGYSLVWYLLNQLFTSVSVNRCDQLTRLFEARWISNAFHLKLRWIIVNYSLVYKKIIVALSSWVLTK